MTNISKAFHSFSEDVNSEESVCLDIFEKITSIFFQGSIWAGIPLFIYFIFLFIN
jgi:hypothetical protein